jgi:hypothetical protein
MNVLEGVSLGVGPGRGVGDGGLGTDAAGGASEVSVAVETALVPPSFDVTITGIVVGPNVSWALMVTVIRHCAPGAIDPPP